MIADLHIHTNRSGGPMLRGGYLGDLECNKKWKTNDVVLTWGCPAV